MLTPYPLIVPMVFGFAFCIGSNAALRELHVFMYNVNPYTLKQQEEIHRYWTKSMIIYNACSNLLKKE